MDSTHSPRTAFDEQRLLHLIVIDKRNQKILLSIKYRDFEKDPESLAISYNPYDDYDGPLTVIPKKGYRILIEGGGWPPISSKSAVVLFVQESAESDSDDEPYRERMRMVLDLLEKGTIDSSISGTIPTPEAYEAHWLHILVLQNLLSTLGLQWVGLSETDPLEFLRVLWAIPSSSEKDAHELVINQVSAQIDRGGTTIGLDIEKMADYEVLAKRVDKVLELRKQEVERLLPLASSQIREGYDYEVSMVDLEDLWYTAHGFAILSDLELGMSCDGEDFLDVQEEFSKIGIDLQTNLDAQKSHQSNISQALKEYIRYISRIDLQEITSAKDVLVIDIVRLIMG
ncbi:MAG: hypothetical protein ACFFED_00265 [Candidatus Thorarchaeota archaeon]